MLYRVSKKKLIPFIFKLSGNLLLEFDNSHFLNVTMYFNSHRELDSFRLINGSLIWYALYILEKFRQLLSKYSLYAANLNVNAMNFFFTDSPCIGIEIC